MTLMKMILNKKKAVSPVIATILLIALTITAAAIVYFVVRPFLQQRSELYVKTAPAPVIGHPNQIEFTIGNIGSVDEQFNYTEVTLKYENNTAILINVLDGDGVAFTGLIIIPANDDVTIIIELASGNYEVGETYVIKIPGLNAFDITYT